MKRLYARDGKHAWAHAIGLISQHEELQPGDALAITKVGAPTAAK